MSIVARALSASRALAVAAAALVTFVPAALSLAAPPVGAGAPAHAMAWGTQPKYPPDFRYFDYVNPGAPKGGTVTLDGFGSFDKLNPFTLKGVSAAGVELLMFETLAEASSDEPFAIYGLLAERMALAEDELSVTFWLDPNARFHNGDAVTALDVKHSFDTLISKQAHPRYRNWFADVARVVVVDPRTIRFEFKGRNHELHMILGVQLPVFSRKWGGGRSFEQIVQDAPIASGPYRVEQVDWGRNVAYRRDPDYWAKDLPTRRGMFNFDRVVYKYFRDETARLEGFKAGAFDWIYENSARNWARGHTGRRYDRGDIVKRMFPHQNAAGMQGFVMNTRRAPFQDVRVRQALTLAMDFEWMNRQIFYGQYVRSPSYFTNSDMAASGKPEGAELELLQSLRAPLSPDVFGEVPMPPTTNPPATLRDNLRQALSLLNQAGWEVTEDGLLRNAEGRALEFEVLSYSKALERLAVPWARNLEKLGIRTTLRVTDPVLFKKRADDFDFDVTVQSLGASQTPGNELIERFTVESAGQPGSDNLAGIRDPAVDELVQRLLQSRTREELVVAARALDRVLRHGHYLVPHFHVAAHRVAYWDKFGIPKTLPTYYGAPTWMLKTWWIAGASGGRERGAAH